MDPVYYHFEEYFAVLLFHEHQYGNWYLCNDKYGKEIVSRGYDLYEQTYTVYKELKNEKDK
jgi:hypothetical protein